MESKLSRWCDGLIEAGWLAAIIAIPLFFNIHSERVFEPDKLTLLRSIAVLMAVMWLVKFIDQQGWRRLNWLSAKNKQAIWHQPFVLPIFTLVVIYLISTIFSVTPRVSWAGSYQRLQGTYTTLSYIVIFALIATTMRSRDQVRRVITAVIITSIPIAFYGLLQHFDLDPLPWGGDVTLRVAGHMGNAIFIAAYLIMVVPLTLGRIIDAFTNILSDDELSNADVIRSSIYIFTLAIQLITIYWSGSRGPLLGLAGGLFAFTVVLLVSLRNTVQDEKGFTFKDAIPALVFLLPTLIALLVSDTVAQATSSLTAFGVYFGVVGLSVLIIFVMVAARSGWKWLWLGWILLTLFMGVWLVLFNIPDATIQNYHNTPVIGGVTRSLSAWRELPTIGSYGKMLDPTQNVGREKSNRVRVLIWDGVIDLITPGAPLAFPDGSNDPFNFLRPFIGYGPESMYVAYNPFYPPELATVEARNASPDRSHNETFDALVITGLFGFLAWQALYISLFYYGFRHLGVVRSVRDRNILFGAWIGGGLLGALISSLAVDPIYLGVAIPSGSIIGLVGYLIYYALVVRGETEQVDPFQVDRLLVNGLVAAAMAHFVEIHFGIAIAASRLHFFVFVALVYVVGTKLPALQTAVSPATTGDKPKPTKSRRRRTTTSTPPSAPKPQGWGGAVWVYAFLLALALGILGYEFMTYSLPPDKIIEVPGDLRASEIFYQSLFINPRRDFIESPFIFLMLMFTWILGGLIALSEMVKHKEWNPPTHLNKPLPGGRNQLLGAGFAIVAVLALAYRFLTPATQFVSTTSLLGRSLILIWVVLCLFAAVRLFLNDGTARLTAGIIALIGVMTALPVIVAGGVLYGLITAVLCLALLYFLWDSTWANIMWPPIIMGTVSLITGLVAAFIQAIRLRGSLLLQPTTAMETVDQIVDFRVLEADRAAGFLNFFYVFIVVILLATAVSLAAPHFRRIRPNGTVWGYVSLTLLFIGALYANAFTNVRVVQADMIYKRARPFDNQATSQSDPQSWTVATAIYARALELVPNEDFYYLFLGRAYLENSTLTADPLARDALLEEAQTRLLQAQDINPLNTDHTANLARLNTRWFQLEQNPTTKPLRLEQAEQYYQTALVLSPQNSVVRNEYAFLALDLKEDCAQSLDIYQDSIEIDPYFATSYFSLADTYLFCAAADSEQRAAYFESAGLALQQGLERDSRNPRAWAQAGQIYQEIGQPEEAVAAYEEAIARNRRSEVPAWNLDFLLATAYQELGDTARAEEFGLQALQGAPETAVSQIQQFLRTVSPDALLPTAPEQEGTLADLDQERPLAGIAPADRLNILPQYPPFVIDTTNSYEAIVTTENGEMRFQLFAAEAPLTVNNFVYLAHQGFYDGTTFHRVIEEFMAQAGDPTGTGSGGPGYQFADETGNGLGFDRAGLLAMANAGPNTNGSQFFITFVPTPHLNGNHTIFGALIAGDEVLNSITFRDPGSGTPGDLIERIEIVETTP
ncbi:MAG: peptidylprolyl isomerase [Chloroflexota bacterium]